MSIAKGAELCAMPVFNRAKPWFVRPGLVPGIHVLKRDQNQKTWMAGTSPAMTISNYRLLNTCDQMAIMPTNSASDASAAASWMTALTMASSPERRENIVHVMFSVKPGWWVSFNWANRPPALACF